MLTPRWRARFRSEPVLCFSHFGRLTGLTEQDRRWPIGMRETRQITAMLRLHRERAGLTQQELAHRSGLSVAAIRDLEQGRSRRPRARSIRALAEALCLPPEDVAFLFHTVPSTSATTAVPLVDPIGTVSIRVLGPFAVYRGDSPVPLGAGRHRAVLARLALTPNTAVRRDELVDLLWGPQVPPSAVNLVQTYVSRLRRILEPRRDVGGHSQMLALVGTGYRLNVDADQLDLLRFRELTSRAAAGAAPADAMSLLDEALALWRGETDVDELRGDALFTALTEEQLTAAIRHADLVQELSDPERTLPRLRELADRHRLHEPLWARLIVALAATGRQAEALAAYDEIRRKLADELGIDPGHQLMEARQGVLRQRWQRIAPQPSPPPVPFQTPAPSADFTGRTDHVNILDQLLRRDPDRAAQQTVAICAVSGVAGVGKTTLAVQAAHRLRASFPDGQLFIDLQGAGPRPVAPVEALARFLRALGLSGRDIPSDEAESAALFRSVLADRRVLVILDNARDAAQVRPLLPGRAGCAALITSRRRLADLAGATTLDLAGFSPSEALRLLESSAGQARAAADPNATRELAVVCGLLPIALRVAGARLASRPTWTVRMLVDRLRDERSRLDQLQIGDTRVSASFHLSYQDLAPSTARAFRLLSLIPGDDFAPDAAAALLGEKAEAVEDDLGELLDANLLQISSSGRYRYHDLLRLYAAGRADIKDSPAARTEARHRLLDWYLARSAAAVRLIYPEMVRLPSELLDEAAFADNQAALGWLDIEIPAIVAAVRQAAGDGPRRRAWEIADQLRAYFFVHRHAVFWLATGEAGLDAAVAEGDRRAQAAMHQTIGQAHWSLGRHERALEEYRKGEALAERSGWLLGAAYLRHNIGLVQAELGRLAEAQESYRRALETSRQHGFRHVQAVTLNDLGAMSHEQGRLAEAVEYFSEALDINVALSRRASVLSNRNNLGMALRQLGEFDAAHGHLQAVLRECRQTADVRGEIGVLDELSQLHSNRGEHVAAVSAARQGLDLSRIAGDKRAEAALLTTLGEALLGSGSTTEALDQFERSHEVAARHSYPYFQTRSQIGIARAQVALGLTEPGIERARRALDAARAGGYRLLEADALVALALGNVAASRPEEATRLCRLAMAIYNGTGSPQHVAEVTRLLERSLTAL